MTRREKKSGGGPRVKPGETMGANCENSGMADQLWIKLVAREAVITLCTNPQDSKRLLLYGLVVALLGRASRHNLGNHPSITKFG